MRVRAPLGEEGGHDAVLLQDVAMLERVAGVVEFPEVAGTAFGSVLDGQGAALGGVSVGDAGLVWFWKNEGAIGLEDD